MTGRLLLAIIVLLCRTGVAGAQNGSIQVSSTADPTTVGLNDQVRLTVTVSGKGVSGPDPQVNPITDFTVRGPYTSTSMSIVNFDATFTKTYTYLLLPEKIGIFEVGRAVVQYEGETYTAPPVKITVLQQSPQQAAPGGTPTPLPPTSPDDSREVFIRTSTDKTTVYVGEQVTFTFELFTSRLLANMEYDPPQTTGFWSVGLPEIPSSTRTVSGIPYEYHSAKTALFPTSPGTLTISGSRFRYAIPGGFFSSSRARTLVADPIEITVRPLPVAGRPEDFNGSVGDFQVSLAVDDTTVAAGDVVTLRVTVAGTGNLDLVTSLGVPDLSEFRTYEPRAAGQLSNSGFTVGGSKTWEYVISPREQGHAIVGPFTLSYFNPADGAYHTVATEPINLVITPGRSVAAGPQSGGTGNDLRNFPADIRYLKPDRSSLETSETVLPHKPVFYLLYVLPLGMFVTVMLVKRHRDAIERDTGKRRRMHAWKRFQHRLGNIRAAFAEGDDKLGCGRLHDAITSFIGDMLNIDTGRLTAGDLEHLLRERNVDSAFSERVRRTLDQCDFVRFASYGMSVDDRSRLLDDTGELLTHLRDIL